MALILAGVGLYLDQLWWRPSKPHDIYFSHQVHVGEKQIDCAFCHRGARGGDIAGVPSVAECASCHTVIKDYKGPQSGEKAKFDGELQKLQKFIADKQEITWGKYYDLAEHVKFSHQAHVSKGIDCAKCHGDVARMNAITLQQTPNMGWCIACHKANDAPINCSVCHF